MEDSAEMLAADSALSVVPVDSFSGCSSGHEAGCGFFFEVAVERCPLCQRVQVPMFCAACVRSGNFSAARDSSSAGDEFSEPPVLFWERHKHCSKLLERLRTKHEKVEVLREQLRTNKDSILLRKTQLHFLKDALKKKIAVVEQRKARLLALKQQNRKTEEWIKLLQEKTKRRKTREDEEKKRIARRQLASDKTLRLLRDKRRHLILQVARKVFAVDVNVPWSRVCNIPLPTLTDENYHILDSSDRTVAALLYAAFFLKAVLLILEIHLPRPLSTAIFGKELVTRDDLVLLYRSLVYVVQRIFGHTEEKQTLSTVGPVLPQLALVFRSPNLGRVGAFLQHRLQWLPTASLETEETGTSNADWVEVPWDIPYDAASAESQMAVTTSAANRSFIQSGAGLVSSWLGFAFGQSSYK